MAALPSAHIPYALSRRRKLWGLLDRFIKKLARRTPDDVKVEAATHHHHATHHSHSNLGTKAERRTRRKIAHESRRVNFQSK